MTDYDQLHRLWARAHASGSPTKFVRNMVVYGELFRLMPGNTLDAGCGTGEYSIFLLKRGHRMTAFDPSPFAIDELSRRVRTESDIQVQVNTIEGFTSPCRSFDNIISIEVLEHVEWDQSAVQRLYALLKPNGTLLVSVPGSPRLYSEADRISGHYRRYTQSSLRQLFHSIGFRQIRIRRYGFPMLLIYSIMRKLFLNSILMDHFSSEASRSRRRPALLSRIYPLLFAVDRLNIPLWSVGYVAVCKK